MAVIECFGARRIPSNFKIKAESHKTFCCMTISVGEDTVTVFLPIESEESARYVAAATAAAFAHLPKDNPETVSGSNIIPLVSTPDHR